MRGGAGGRGGGPCKSTSRPARHTTCVCKCGTRGKGAGPRCSAWARTGGNASGSAGGPAAPLLAAAGGRRHGGGSRQGPLAGGNGVAKGGGGSTGRRRPEKSSQRRERNKQYKLHRNHQPGQDKGPTRGITEETSGGGRLSQTGYGAGHACHCLPPPSPPPLPRSTCPRTPPPPMTPRRKWEARTKV